MMANVYDFDKTIYDGDVSVDFWLFSLKKHPAIAILLPIQFFAIVLMKLKLLSRKTTKEIFFLFLRFLKNLDLMEFWDINQAKIKPWYLKQKHPNDIIITASPEFAIQPLADKLKINLIGTIMSTKTGKITGENCRGIEKVRRFRKKYRNTKIGRFYSDSLSDLPLKELSTQAFIVKGIKIKKWS